MNQQFQEFLLKNTNASSCQEVDVIQSLWSGYGKISRYALQGAATETVVVKHISLDKASNHPRGWNTNLGHQRKIKSYQVEIEWYKHWNHQCTQGCSTAQFLGSFSLDNEHWIILEDLDRLFPIRQPYLEVNQLKPCLDWLANFHATFMQQQPAGLWEVGTYWHLATRPEEFEKIENLALKQKAHQIDEQLNNCTYQTIVHGDAKVANFCFDTNGNAVSAVDFQYVGGGCGMKDFVYFLGSCLTEEECEESAPAMLDYYFDTLKQALQSSGSTIDTDQLEQEWRGMYALAWTDFTRFLLGWMPTHQKVNSYSGKLMEEVLQRLG